MGPAFSRLRTGRPVAALAEESFGVEGQLEVSLGCGEGWEAAGWSPQQVFTTWPLCARPRARLSGWRDFNEWSSRLLGSLVQGVINAIANIFFTFKLHK